MERFNLKKLNKVDGSIMLKCQIGLQLWKTHAEVDINRAWKTIMENINISAKEEPRLL
jgi:hypothetical protein